MIIVGVTGSLATGKSEVSHIFQKLGAKVFDADLSARKMTKKGTPIHHAIIKLFGKSYMQKNGELDRRKLALHVFGKPSELKKLNVLIHPGVIFDCMTQAKKLESKEGIFVLDVPLLFESKMEKLADHVVVISVKEEEVIARAVKRGYTKELAKKILASQWPLKKKEKMADFVIDNNGTLKQLEMQVKQVYDSIIGGKK